MVGSSSSRYFGWANSTPASSTRIRHPPEKSEQGRSCAAASNPSPRRIALARASADGFNDGIADHAPEPYRGYYFRILDAQGPAAPGGPMSYLVNGHMLSGHALIGFPAVYGETGVNTFVVAENGLILEADLGPDTVSLADAIDAYDPGDDWVPVN